MGRIYKSRNKETSIQKSVEPIQSETKNNKTKKLIGKLDLKLISKKKPNKSAITTKVRFINIFIINFYFIHIDLNCFQVEKK